MALKPLDHLPRTDLKIKRALISLSDKSQLEVLAKALHQAGVEILSTGGTAAAIRNMDIPVKDVSEITQFQECLDGRVKTLHPFVHAGILARTSHQPDVDELNKLEVEPIELVAVNLYPFKQTIASGNNSLEVATENIDIGGPTMIRAAAKNFAHVCVLTSPAQYESFAAELNEKGAIAFDSRQKLAKTAFNHTADYDAAIANYFNGLDEEEKILPKNIHLSEEQAHDLRYGENPHQAAAVYGNPLEYIEILHGKQLSYNNYLDIDGALSLISDFEDNQKVCAIFKHTVPCGVAIGDTLEAAYQKAFSTDKVSPFGGIVIVNQTLDLATAKAIDAIFTEIIIAPAYDDDALEMLKQKKNRRLIKMTGKTIKDAPLQLKSIFGGIVAQQKDTYTVKESDLKVVTERQPSEKEQIDLMLAWKIVKHVKSNAIVYVKDGQTVGIGTGQTSRVDSSKIAIAKAKEEGLDLKDCVIASDAFFPFADGVSAAAEAGATAVIQPGGSVRDEEVIAEADKRKMTMVFTGYRHFRH